MKLFKQIDKEEAEIKKHKAAEIEKVKNNVVKEDHDYFIITFKKSEIIDISGKSSLNAQMFNHTLPDEFINVLVGIMEARPQLEPMFMKALAVRKSKQKSNVTIATPTKK